MTVWELVGCEFAGEEAVCIGAVDTEVVGAEEQQSDEQAAHDEDSNLNSQTRRVDTGRTPQAKAEVVDPWFMFDCCDGILFWICDCVYFDQTRQFEDDHLTPKRQRDRYKLKVPIL